VSFESHFGPEVSKDPNQTGDEASTCNYSDEDDIIQSWINEAVGCGPLTPNSINSNASEEESIEMEAEFDGELTAFCEEFISDKEPTSNLYDDLYFTF